MLRAWGSIPATPLGIKLPLLVPGPVGELLAEGDFFEFADTGAGDFGEEDEGVG
jgi:hypothetical protein